MNLLYKFKAARMTQAERMTELLAVAAANDTKSTKKMDYLLKAVPLDSDPLASFDIVNYATRQVFERLLSRQSLSQRTQEEYAGMTVTCDRPDLLGILFKQGLTLKQEQKDELLWKATVAAFVWAPPKMAESKIALAKILIRQGADLKKVSGKIEEGYKYEPAALEAFKSFTAKLTPPTGRGGPRPL